LAKKKLFYKFSNFTTDPNYARKWHKGKWGKDVIGVRSYKIQGARQKGTPVNYAVYLKMRR
jgi:hypothetical protein